MMSNGIDKEVDELKEIVEKFKQDNPERAFFLSDEQIIQFITKPIAQEKLTASLPDYIIIKGKTLKKGDRVRVKSTSNDTLQYLIGTIQTVRQRKVSGSYYRRISTIYLEGVSWSFARNDLEAIKFIEDETQPLRGATKQAVMVDFNDAGNPIGVVGPTGSVGPVGIPKIETTDRVEFDYKNVEKNNIVINGQEYYAIKGKTLVVGDLVIIKQTGSSYYKQFKNKICKIKGRVVNGTPKYYEIMIDGITRSFYRSILIAVEKVKEPLIKKQQPVSELDLKVGDLVRISKAYLEKGQMIYVGMRQKIVKITGKGNGVRFFIKDVPGWFSRECLEKVVIIYTDKE